MRGLHFVKSSFSTQRVITIATTCLSAMGQTLLSRRESYLGFYRELRKSAQNAKRKAQDGNTIEAYSINVCADDGCSCSSDETFVMKAERRTAVIQF